MRVAVVGPESVGKSTLALWLGRRLGRPVVGEFARGYLEARDGRIEAGDMPVIFEGQWAIENASAGDAVLDTDVRMTILWWERLFPPCPLEYYARVRELEPRMTLLLAPDVPWVADPVRYLPGEGEAFFDACASLLTRLGHPFGVVSGSWQERERRVELLLGGR